MHILKGGIAFSTKLKFVEKIIVKYLVKRNVELKKKLIM